MEYIKDFINVNKEAFKNSIKKIKYLPLLTIIILLVSKLGNFVQIMLSQGGTTTSFLLGFVRYIVQILALSLIVGALSDIVNYNRLSFKSIILGFENYFNALLNTFGIFYIIEYIITYFLRTTISNNVIMLIISVIFLFIESILLEQVYIANNEGNYVLTEAIGFLKNNFVQYMPVGLIFAILRVLFEVSSIIMFNFSSILKLLILTVCISFIYIYKGELFKILYKSSMRKRQFQGKF